MNRPNIPTTEPRDYVRVLRTRKWTIIVVTVVATTVALVLSSLQTPKYRAEARILVKLPNTTGDTTVPQSSLLETEAQLVQSEEVAARVIDELALDTTPRSIITNLSVAPVRQTDILVVAYSASDPERASDIANAFAEKYIEFRQDRTRKRLKAAQRAVQERIQKTIQRRLNNQALLKQARRHGSAAEVAALLSQRDLLVARLSALQGQLDSIQPDRSAKLAGGEIVDEADTPGSPSSPNVPRDGIFGFVLGLALGGGLALLRDRFDDRFRDRDDIERTVGAPVLATIPVIEIAGPGPDALVAAQARGAAVEAYRRLRANVHLLASRRGLKTLLVTSALPDEGKTMTVANLAVSLAQSGLKVVLVSADLRRPTVEKYFGLEDSREGVATWLAGESEDIGSLIRDTAVPSLKVLPTGRTSASPAELLTPLQVSELFRVLEGTFDFVLVDSPPTLPVVDAAILAMHAHGTILVVGENGTRRAVIDAIAELGGEISGCVLNEFEIPGRDYDSYGYLEPANEDAPEADKEEGATAGTEAVRKRLRFLPGRRK